MHTVHRAEKAGRKDGARPGKKKWDKRQENIS